MSEYPIRIIDADGELIDACDNMETAACILYGDLSYHDGQARTIYAPERFENALKHEAAINADCWGIPLDKVVALEWGNNEQRF